MAYVAHRLALVVVTVAHKRRREDGGESGAAVTTRDAHHLPDEELEARLRR